MSLALIKNKWSHVKSFKSIFEQKSIWIVWYQTGSINHLYWRSWSWKVLRSAKRPSRTNNKKRCPFQQGEWNSKVESKEITGVTDKFGLGVQNEAGHRLTEFCQGNALILANTLYQQHKRWLYTWTSPDGQYQNQIDYILCSQRWRSSIQSAKTRPESDCGSDMKALLQNSDINWRK